MLHLFQSLAARIKALFVTDAALDLEAEFLARDAERKAALLRQADRYEAEGLGAVARDLRAQAEALYPRQPLAVVVPALAAWQAEALLLQERTPAASIAPEPSTAKPAKKKGRE